MQDVGAAAKCAGRQVHADLLVLSNDVLQAQPCLMRACSCPLNGHGLNSCMKSAGGVWADQLVRWRAYRKHGCTIFVLVLASVLFLILGFIPFMDNFFHIIAFACGTLMTSALLKPRGARVSSTFFIMRHVPWHIPWRIAHRRNVGACCLWAWSWQR